MEVRLATADDVLAGDIIAADRGKVLLYIGSEYTPDARVTLEQLLELRAAIDRFLFLQGFRHIRTEFEP